MLPKNTLTREDYTSEDQISIYPAGGHKKQDFCVSNVSLH